MRVLVRHCDPNSTGEGLGSHARGTLYPLLRVSLAFQWEILWQPSEQPCWSSKGNTTRPEYEQDCHDLGEWLGFEERFENLDHSSLTIVHIDLEDDPRLGRILGSPVILIDSIREYIQEHGENDFYSETSSTSLSLQEQDRTVLISLNGRFQYRDDPTTPVINYLQSLRDKWRSSQYAESCPDEPRALRIVAHIRVPEDYCSQEWKDANSIDHMLDTLRVVYSHCTELQPNLPVKLDVYTESTFGSKEEEALSTQVESMLEHGTLTIHRQTPLLPCVTGMATADIFIPASSFLSAFASFFQSSLIVLPNESTRHEKYFAPHLQHAHKMDQGSLPCPSDKNTTCPIVRVESEEVHLRNAIQQVLLTTTYSRDFAG